MANDGDKAKIEIEIALRDSMSTVLRSMGTELQKINKQALELGTSGNVAFGKLTEVSSGTVGAFEKFRKQNEALNDSAKRSNTSLTSMQAIFAGLTRGLTGTAGLAYGLYKVTEALDNMAIASLQMRNLSVDTGLATRSLNEMTQAYQRMGKSREEGLNIASTFANQINDLRIHKYESGVAQGFLKRPGGNVLVDKWIAMINAGATNEQIIEDVQKTFPNQTKPGSKEAFARDWNQPISAFQNYEQYKAQNKPMLEVDPAAAERASKRQNDLRVFFGNLGTGAVNLNNRSEDFIEGVGGSKSFVGPSPYGWITPKTMENMRKFLPINEEANQYMGFKVPGPQSSTGTHPDITDFGGRRRDKEVDLLSEIRDSLQRMEAGPGISGSGSGVGYGIGARGGALQASLGGFRRGDGRDPTKADPRGLAGYIKETAAKYGIDPDTALRVAQSEGLSSFTGDHGTSFGALQAHIGGGLGDEYKKQTGRDPSDPANEKHLIDWQLKKAGTEGWGPYHGARRVGVGDMMGIGGRPGYVGASGGTAGDGRSLTGVDPRLVDIARSGAKYLPEGYTIKPTSGFLGRSGSGFHPKGLASDWQIYGPDGKPIANRGDDPTGLYQRWAQGSYTEAMKNYPEIAKQLGWGGAFETSRGSGVRDLMHLDLGGDRGRLSPQHQLGAMGPLPDDARKQLDKSQSNAAPWGKGAIKVDFLNVPNGVKTSAEVAGPMFPELEINRTKSQGRPWEPPPY
jgi:hypothetical protein